MIRRSRLRHHGMGACPRTAGLYASAESQHHFLSQACERGGTRVLPLAASFHLLHVQPTMVHEERPNDKSKKPARGSPGWEGDRKRRDNGHPVWQPVMQGSRRGGPTLLGARTCVGNCMGRADTYRWDGARGLSGHDPLADGTGRSMVNTSASRPPVAVVASSGMIGVLERAGNRKSGAEKRSGCCHARSSVGGLSDISRLRHRLPGRIGVRSAAQPETYNTNPRMQTRQVRYRRERCAGR